MTEWSACIEMLFAREHDDFPARIRAAKAAGFEAVEFWRASGKDLDAVERVLKEEGVALAGLLAEPTLQLTDPATHADFLAGFLASVAVARRLGARVMIAVTGDALPDVPRAAQRAALVSVLSAAADVLEGSGIVLALEPLNDRVDHKGYYLTSTVDALDIIDAVGRPEVRLLYDIYHSAVMGEDTATVLAGRVDRVAHVHLADAPGRGEPGSGAMDWRQRLAWLAANGYRGQVGLEYRPTGNTVASLGFRGEPR